MKIKNMLMHMNSVKEFIAQGSALDAVGDTTVTRTLIQTIVKSPDGRTKLVSTLIDAADM